MQCGYLAVGAGVKAPPKKKYKKGRYREPGSATPFLAFLLVLAVLGWAGVEQPWRNAFESVRVAFGAEPSRSVEGRWEVLKLVAVDPVSKRELGSTSMATGSLAFDKDRRAQIRLLQGGTNFAINGAYEVNGYSLTLRELSANPQMQLPPAIDSRLSWLNQDAVVLAMNTNAALYLRRMERGDKPAKTITLRRSGNE
jgi:hypothetical protein